MTPSLPMYQFGTRSGSTPYTCAHWEGRDKVLFECTLSLCPAYLPTSVRDSHGVCAGIVASICSNARLCWQRVMLGPGDPGDLSHMCLDGGRKKDQHYAGGDTLFLLGQPRLLHENNHLLCALPGSGTHVPVPDHC